MSALHGQIRNLPEQSLKCMVLANMPTVIIVSISYVMSFNRFKLGLIVNIIIVHRGDNNLFDR